MARTEFSKRVRCTKCGDWFDRAYNISAKRRSRPQFCSQSCQTAHWQVNAEVRLEARFWSRVAHADKRGCMAWTGRLDPNGYGRIDYQGRPTLAHRVAYELTNGPAVGGVVMHTCDNPQCCNPDHLRLGTQADNVADMDMKGRRRVGVRRGAECNKTKLTEDQVRLVFSSLEKPADLAARFGVSTTAIRYIQSGRNWRHVTGGRHGRPHS